MRDLNSLHAMNESAVIKTACKSTLEKLEKIQIEFAKLGSSALVNEQIELARELHTDVSGITTRNDVFEFFRKWAGRHGASKGTVSGEAIDKACGYLGRRLSEVGVTPTQEECERIQEAYDEACILREAEAIRDSD